MNRRQRENAAPVTSCTVFYTTFWVLAAAPLVTPLAMLVIPLAARLCRVRKTPVTLYKTAVVMAAFLMYPPVTHQAASMLGCSPPIAGVRYVTADNRVTFDTAVYTVHAVAAGSGSAPACLLPWRGDCHECSEQGCCTRSPCERLGCS